MATKLGIDMGQSSIKIAGADGILQFASQAALITNTSVDVPIPGRRVKRPMIVRADNVGEMFVGYGAHRWGNPVENFDYARLAGVTPEMRAILYGALAEYQKKFGRFEEPVEVVLGLPIQMLTGENEQREKYERQVKGWVGGEHRWQANGEDFDATIVKVGLLPQALGAVIDYAFNMDGTAVSAEHNKALTQECAMLWIGSNTVELQVTKRNEDTKRYNGGAPLGVRWLHSQCDPEGLWTFGEFDEMLRNSDLPEGMSVEPFLDPWATTILGFTSRKWREDWKRFYRIFVGGGGSYPLEGRMVARFNGKVVIPKDRINAIALGMYKAAMRSK